MASARDAFRCHEAIDAFAAHVDAVAGVGADGDDAVVVVVVDDDDDGDKVDVVVHHLSLD